MTYILSIITIITMVLAGNKSRWAWVIGLGNQALWGFYIVHTGQWGLSLMTAAITIVYARNLAKWKASKESSEGELFSVEECLDMQRCVNARTNAMLDDRESMYGKPGRDGVGSPAHGMPGPEGVRIPAGNDTK